MDLASWAVVLGWAMAGWLGGSVLAMVARALPQDRAIGNAVCSGCGAALDMGLRPWLGIPWSGYCATCRQPELVADPAMPLASAVVFAALAWKLGLTWGLVTSSVVAAALVLVMFLDLRHRLVYGIVVYPAVVLAVVLLPLTRWPQASVWSGLLGMVVGGGVFAVLYLAGRIIYRGEEPLGTGDIFVGGLMGAVAGLDRVAPALLLGVMVSAIFALVHGIRSRSLRAYVAYAPGLCLAGIVSLFWD